MALPKVLPISAVTLLIDYLTPGGRSYSVRELVEAGYDLEGYVLDQLFPEDPQPKFAADSKVLEMEDVEVLKLLVAKQGVVDNIPWLLVLEIVNRILDYYRPRT